MDRTLCSDIPEYPLSIYPDSPAVVSRKPVTGGISGEKWFKDGKEIARPAAPDANRRYSGENVLKRHREILAVRRAGAEAPPSAAASAAGDEPVRGGGVAVDMRQVCILAPEVR
jgi:hypothetical protein